METQKKRSTCTWNKLTNQGRRCSYMPKISKIPKIHWCLFWQIFEMSINHNWYFTLLMVSVFSRPKFHTVVKHDWCNWNYGCILFTKHKQTLQAVTTFPGLLTISRKYILKKPHPLNGKSTFDFFFTRHLN